MSDERFDLVVVGGGAAGLTGARFAARLGARVALVERARVGGDCTWTGCVPSKTLLAIARRVHGARGVERFGLALEPPARVRFEAVRDAVRAVIDEVYAHEDPAALAREGVCVVEGSARFTGPRTLGVGTRTLRAQRVVLCTGARAVAPAVPGLEGVAYLTHEGFFELEALPETLAVLGGGPVGLELAQACARLGARVIVCAQELLPREDDDARAVVREALEADGVRFALGPVRGVAREAGGVLLDAAGVAVRAERLLVAAGRAPNVEGLALERGGVSYSDRGVLVDAWLRTSAKGVYAAGDVLGGPQFTHYAGWQCFQAVRNALLPGRARGGAAVLPRVTFVDPEVACVGETERSGRARWGASLGVHTLPLARVDRALCEGATRGFVKLLTDPSGRLAGAVIVAPCAGEMLAELTVAVAERRRLEALANTIHAYPTWSSAVQQLAAAASVEAFVEGALGRAVRRAKGYRVER